MGLLALATLTPFSATKLMVGALSLSLMRKVGLLLVRSTTWLSSLRPPATVSSYTKVKLPKGVRSTYTACKEAITVKEMNAICEATEGLNNLTVFKQRNISNVTAGETATFKLWTVGKRNSAVVLFRAEGATEWTILAQGEAGQKEVADVALPGNGAYAVCMAW